MNFSKAKFIHNTNGFTLVELLLYISVAASILLIISLLLSMLWQAKIKNQVVAEVEQQGAFIMRKLAENIQNSNSISLPISGQSGSTLNLATFSSSTNPVVITLEDESVKIFEGANPAYLLNAANISVSNLEFTNLSSNNSNIIKIGFTVSYKSTSTQNEYQYQTNFYDSISLRK